MGRQSSQELVESSLSLLQECLTHVVKIPGHLFAREWLVGRGGRGRDEGTYEGRGEKELSM